MKSVVKYKRNHRRLLPNGFGFFHEALQFTIQELWTNLRQTARWISACDTERIFALPCPFSSFLPSCLSFFFLLLILQYFLLPFSSIFSSLSLPIFTFSAQILSYTFWPPGGGWGRPTAPSKPPLFEEGYWQHWKQSPFTSRCEFCW